MKKQSELWFEGTPVSAGIAMGEPFFLKLEEEFVLEKSIELADVDQEITRYRQALLYSREDLQKLQLDLKGSQDVEGILGSHIQMLEDPLITTEVEEKIREKLRNTESVFQSVICDYQKTYQTQDCFFQDRLGDVMDLAKRVLGHLRPVTDRRESSETPLHSIVFASKLTPSYTAAVQSSQVHAFVTLYGGGNSHAALIARAKGIPYVICPDLEKLDSAEVDFVIVDGHTGKIIINPTEETKTKFTRKQELLARQNLAFCQLASLCTETRDGFSAQVLANIGDMGDLKDLKKSGADGVGLFRTEYLFLESIQSLPSEEFQEKIYREVIELVAGSPVVIRVFDVGGDKQFGSLLSLPREPNPMLGARGIRFLFRHPDLFRTQLRAIFRAAKAGDVRILLPFICDESELLLAKEIVKEAQQEASLPLGCMIEVPSAALLCDHLARHADFFAIGTNDLQQYALGKDRNSCDKTEESTLIHPSVLRMVRMVAAEAKRSNKGVSVCGEIASNPQMIPLLLGLGITQFSCSPRYIPHVKQAIRQTLFKEAQELAEEILSLSTSSAIVYRLECYSKDRLPVESSSTFP